MTIWCMRIACWVPKTTNTHSGCVMLIAFPVQQWLHKCASVLYIHRLSCFNVPVVNRLVPELFFLILARSVYKM